MEKKSKKKQNLVVICGRTNVGKSTLFNCLTEKHQALVSDIAGTTRDSNLGLVEWAGRRFELIDTAGLLDWHYLTASRTSPRQTDIDSQAQQQAISYLDQADVILFMVDAKAGLLPEDKQLAAALKKSGRYNSKILLVANKVDSFRLTTEAAQFNKLNLGEPLAVSAASGLGTGDLLDVVTSYFKKEKITKKTDEEIPLIKACIIGKPNVGKSSLLNSILGYNRVIVSPLPHTTREPQNIEINYQSRRIQLIDTAGISKQGKKGAGLEKPGILKSLSSLNKADVALLVLDISEPLTHQDSKLIEEVVERHTSLILIANKWDKVIQRDTKKWAASLYDKLPFAAWAPVQFISAKTGEKVHKILDLILTVADQRKLTLSDSQTEKFFKQVIKIHKPAKGKGLKAPRIYEFRQTKNNPPAFSVRIGPNDNLHFSYLRFMENRLREKYGFLGTPISLSVAKHYKSHTTYNE